MLLARYHKGVVITISTAHKLLVRAATDMNMTAGKCVVSAAMDESHKQHWHSTLLQVEVVSIEAGGALGRPLSTFAALGPQGVNGQRIRLSSDGSWRLMLCTLARDEGVCYALDNGTSARPEIVDKDIKYDRLVGASELITDLMQILE